MTVRRNWRTGESDIPQSWFEAQTKLGKGRISRYIGGGKNTRTYIKWRATNENWPTADFAIQLASTDVVTFHYGDEITLSSGGWRTVTTKSRINNALPGGWAVWSRRVQKHGYRYSEWWLYYRGIPVRKFEDGMRFNPDDNIVTDNVVIQRNHRAAASRRTVPTTAERLQAIDREFGWDGSSDSYSSDGNFGTLKELLSV